MFVTIFYYFTCLPRRAHIIVVNLLFLLRTEVMKTTTYLLTRNTKECIT